MIGKIRKALREALEPRDIIITVPKTVSWEDYEKELEVVKDGSSVMNFKVRGFPNTAVGRKCYVVYNNHLIGWMQIVGLSKKEFVCSVTGKEWKGYFIERSGPFHKITPEPKRGFQGIRYK